MSDMWVLCRHLEIAMVAARVDLSPVERRTDRTPRLAAMAAVGKLTVPHQILHFGKAERYIFGGKVPKLDLT